MIKYLPKHSAVFFVSIAAVLLASCGVYTFKDISIDYSKIKTVKIGFLENRASYKNPQLSSRLTDQLQQKISSQTKLTRTNNDDANLQISGYISSYSISTAGISSQPGSRQQAATNRLTVGVHINVLNNVENKTDQYDVSRAFDFSAGLTLQQAESQLLDDIIKNVTDEIFNKIFSNW